MEIVQACGFVLLGAAGGASLTAYYFTDRQRKRDAEVRAALKDVREQFRALRKALPSAIDTPQSR